MYRQIFTRLFSAAIVCILTLTLTGESLAQKRKTSKPTGTAKQAAASAEDFCDRAIEYVAGKQYELAMENYDKAINLNPKSDEAYFGRGYIYLQYKSYAAALKEFLRAIEFNPKNTNAVQGRDYCLAMMARGDLSLEEYDQLIAVEPDKAKYYFYRSRVYMKSKQFIKAVEDSSKAIEIDPNYTDAYMVRAYSYCEIGRRKESIADVAKHDQLRGRKTQGTCLIDIKHCAKDDDECRMEVFTEGINKPSELALFNRLDAYYIGRGNIFYKRGDFDRALSDFNKGLSKPGNYLEYWYRGKILWGKGKYEEALEDFNYAFYGVKDSAELYYYIGQSHFMKREYERAFDYFDKAIFLNPRLSAAYLGRGIIYYERGRNYGDFENDQIKAAESYKNALKDFDSIIQIALNEAPPEVYIKRAKTFEKLGEEEKAEADRRKYKELSEKP